jgi:hypothetical protein
MNFAVLVTQLPSTANEHARLLTFGECLQPLPEGVFQPAQNVWMATRADAEEFIHSAKVTAAELGVELKTYSGDIDRRVLVS